LKVKFPARLLRSAALAGAVMVSLGLTGCGKANNPNSAENDGVYEQAGNVTYQLEVSRQLNQYTTEDSQYVKGVPSSDSTLGASALWYGVFLWAKNQTKSPQKTTGRFDIVDTEGHHYYPIPLNTSLNPFAWTAQMLPPDAIEPAPGTIAGDGPTQGGLLLFKLNESVYSDRPLTLEIRSPSSNQVQATILLDL
jgi:hypothetical protein